MAASLALVLAMSLPLETRAQAPGPKAPPASQVGQGGDPGGPLKSEPPEATSLPLGTREQGPGPKAPPASQVEQGNPGPLKSEPPEGQTLTPPSSHAAKSAIQPVPELQEVRVLRSNYRRVIWGHALTGAGVVGVLAAAAGMVVVGQGADRYRGLRSLPKPLSPPTQKRLDELSTQRNVGLGLAIGGASLGLLGLVLGPLLVRSARQRERARQMSRWSQFRPRLSFSLVYTGTDR